MTKDYAKHRPKFFTKRYNRYHKNITPSTGLPSWAWVLCGIVFGVILSGSIFWKCSKNTADTAPLVTNTLTVVPLTARTAAPSRASKTHTHKAVAPTVAPTTKLISIPVHPPTPEAARFDFYTLLPTMNADPTHTEESCQSKKSILPYILQAGSFKTQEQAEQLKAVLALQGLDAHIQTVKINAAECWYRVYIGPFDTKADALNVQQNLENESQPHSDHSMHSVILKMRV